MKKIIGALFLLVAIKQSVHAQMPDAYILEMKEWDAKRIQSLKSPTGWLNLAGLFWLKPGANTFGSGSGSVLQFPEGTLAQRAGSINWIGKMVVMKVERGVHISVNGIGVNTAIIYHPDSSNIPVVASGSLRWSIIQREDKMGVRLRDLNHPALHQFKGLERFPVDTAWRITATIEKGNTPYVSITNVLGQTTAQPSPGKLSFTLQGQIYTLDAIDEGNDLLIVFGDATSGKTTYEAGRFVYVSKPGADGKTTLDFNKAFNPPCAFTPYATCQLPPPQNILPIEITAGEKNYVHHD